MKKSNARWALVGMLALVAALAMGLAGCGSDSAPSSSSGSANQQSEQSEEPQEAEPVELYNDNGIVITAGAKESDILGCTIPITISNNSSSNINVEIDKVSVDGTMVDTWFYEDVAAGKNANAELECYDVSTLDEFINIEGALTIIDSDTYGTISEVSFSIA